MTSSERHWKLAMEKVRVLLSVRQQLHAQLLRYFFSSNDGFELIGEAEAAIDILMMLDVHKPNLWIHSWEPGSAIEGMLSHIYVSHPDLSIVRMSPDELTGFAQHPINSIAELMEFALSSGRLPVTA